MPTGEVDFVEVYSIPDFAKLLGKTVLTVKRWISEGIIPPPLIEDTSRGYKHYFPKEVSVMKKELDKHFCSYDYLHNTHEDTIHRVWQAVEAVRRTLWGNNDE